MMLMVVSLLTGSRHAGVDGVEVFIAVDVGIHDE